MTDDTKSTAFNPAAGVCPAWWVTATLAMFFGLVLAVLGAVFGSWPMVGASAVLLAYGSYCARLVIAVSAQNSASKAIGDGVSMLAALRSQGN